MGECFKPLRELLGCPAKTSHRGIINSAVRRLEELTTYVKQLESNAAIDIDPKLIDENGSLTAPGLTDLIPPPSTPF